MLRIALGHAFAQPYGSTATVSPFLFRGLDVNSYHQLVAATSKSVYYKFQLTFAITSLVLIYGIFANRMKFTSMKLFITLWYLAVYCPVSYVCWNWELERFYYINDDAVGNLVHFVSGVSALVSAIILGPRKGFGNVMHSITGVCFLWVAWFGLNAVLATTSGNNVEMVLLATLIATAGASLSWMLVEWYLTGIPKLTAIGSGAIAGIIAITPASAHVLDCEGAFFLGLYAGPACFAGIQLKCYLGYDDELDVFAIHAIGGILGGFITGLVVADQVNRGYSGLNYMNTWDGGNQRLLQVYSMLFCFGWTGVVTFLILKTIDLTIGLRVNEDDEHA